MNSQCWRQKDKHPSIQQNRGITENKKDMPIDFLGKLENGCWSALRTKALSPFHPHVPISGIDIDCL